MATILLVILPLKNCNFATLGGSAKGQGKGVAGHQWIGWSSKTGWGYCHFLTFRTTWILSPAALVGNVFHTKFLSVIMFLAAQCTIGYLGLPKLQNVEKVDACFSVKKFWPEYEPDFVQHVFINFTENKYGQNHGQCSEKVEPKNRGLYGCFNQFLGPHKYPKLWHFFQIVKIENQVPTLYVQCWGSEVFSILLLHLTGTSSCLHSHSQVTWQRRNCIDECRNTLQFRQIHFAI